ncbi:MAG: metallophosphoesterase [bacterium]
MSGLLYSNSIALAAYAPRGSCRQAARSPVRHQFENLFGAAYTIAVASGLIRNKIIALEGRSLSFKFGDNLRMVKEVAAVLAGVLKEGPIIPVADGPVQEPAEIEEISGSKLYFATKAEGQDAQAQRLCLAKPLAERLMARLKLIYTPSYDFDEEKALANLHEALAEMLCPVSSGEVSSWRKFAHNFTTVSFYRAQLIRRMAINMSAGRVLYDYKRREVERTGIVDSRTQFQLDGELSWVEQEARTKDIQEVRRSLEIDNPVKLEADGDLVGKDLDFVISDIHLREFLHEYTDQLLRFIHMVTRADGRLVINGDFFDVWRSGALEEVLCNNTRVINALAAVREVVFVVGNHDEFLSTLARRGGHFLRDNFKVVNEYRSPDSRLRVLHGHQSDRFNRPGSWIGRAITKAITAMEMNWWTKTLAGLGKSLMIFSWAAGFFRFVLGPRLSSRLELLINLVLPTKYVIGRKAQNIVDWLEVEVNNAIRFDGMVLNDMEPLTYVIGHFHDQGHPFLATLVAKKVEAKWGNKVRAVMVDSWEGGQGYVGEYLCLAKAGETLTGRKIVRKKLWKEPLDIAV